MILFDLILQQNLTALDNQYVWKSKGRIGVNDLAMMRYIPLIFFNQGIVQSVGYTNLGLEGDSGVGEWEWPFKMSQIRLRGRIQS